MGPQLWKTATTLLSPPLLSCWAGAMGMGPFTVQVSTWGRGSKAGTHTTTHTLCSPQGPICF